MKRRSFLGFLLGAPVGLKGVAEAVTTAALPSAGLSGLGAFGAELQSGSALNFGLIVDGSISADKICVGGEIFEGRERFVAAMARQVEDLNARLAEDLSAYDREISRLAAPVAADDLLAYSFGG